MLGKILGATTGFFLGGGSPLGAFIGGIIGHMFDKEAEMQLGGIIQCPNCKTRLKIDAPGNYICPTCNSRIFADPKNQHTDRNYQNNYSRSTYDSNNKNVSTAFYVILISILAKMIKADGKVTQNEIRTVKDFFRYQLNLDTNSLNDVKLILKEALKNEQNINELILQFKKMAPRDLFPELINMLYKIAFSDGEFHRNEEDLINTVVNLLGITATEHRQIRAMYQNETERYYKILGVTSTASDKEIKRAYRKLVTQYHPDKLLSKGLPEDFIKFANEKMNEINNAYDNIVKIRGIK